MPSTTILKPILLATAAMSAIAFCVPSATLAQYQVLEVAPAEEESISLEPKNEAPDTEENEGSEPATTIEPEESASAPYLWTLSVSADGLIVTGDVLAAAFQQFLAVRAQAVLTDETDIRAGAPDGFTIDALAALEAARLLASGQAGLDENGWFIEGDLASGRTRDDVLAALAAGATPAEQWRITVEQAPAIDPGNESGGEADIDVDAESATPPDIIPELFPEIESDTAAPSEPSVSVPAPDYTFQAVKRLDGTVLLSGNAPASILQAMLELEGIPTEIGRLTTNPAAPEGFAEAAMSGLRALAALETGQVVLRNGQWLLSGIAEIDTVSNAAIATLAEQTPGLSWKTLVRAPQAIDVCRERVSAYMADKAILFPSAGAVPTPASLELLPGLAEHLAICPDAPVYVEGHTDADGTAEANLALSIRRAESVVDALVDLGVDPSRLYAVGYGASLPIASNNTADGKRQNRRIVFSFEDIAQPLP